MQLSTQSSNLDALAKHNSDGNQGAAEGGRGGATNALCPDGAMCVCGSPRAENGFCECTRVAVRERGCVRNGLIRERTCSVVRESYESAISWLEGIPVWMY